LVLAAVYTSSARAVSAVTPKAGASPRGAPQPLCGWQGRLAAALALPVNPHRPSRCHADRPCGGSAWRGIGRRRKPGVSEAGPRWLRPALRPRTRRGRLGRRGVRCVVSDASEEAQVCSQPFVTYCELAGLHLLPSPSWAGPHLLRRQLYFVTYSFIFYL
jgi:hypothetical protein